MATYFSILAWRIPWTEEPGGLQPIGSQRIRMTDVIAHRTAHCIILIILEANQISTDGWMDKENVVYSYKSILFSLEKKGNYDPCYEMNEPWGHYVKYE